MRSQWWRLLMGLTLGVLAVIEAQMLAATLRSQAQEKADALWRVREEAVSRRPALEQILASGASADLRAGAAALPSWFAAEVEIFEEGGALVQAHPRPAPVSDWPAESDMATLRRGLFLTVGPFVTEAPRILTYLHAPVGARPRVLRIASPAADIVKAQIERRDAALAHGAAVIVVLIAILLIVLPARTETADTGHGVLRAYEEAMGRLQARGAALSQQYARETEQLRSALDDRDAMARAGELTAGIVHEVRNGLGTIGGYAQLLERGAPNESMADAARQIRGECATLETVVRRFMEFVKSESLTLAPFDVGRMLGRVAAREGRGAGSAQIHLPDPLPAITIVGDEEMLERAFENLVRNAREAAGEGGHVRVELAAIERDVIVGIADDGPGMSAERRDAIRPFMSSKGSLGLGLPTALKIVNLHGGDLVLVDRRPRGLQVTVRLPSGPRVDDAATATDL
jgi:signal transduction histidine kinase